MVQNDSQPTPPAKPAISPERRRHSKAMALLVPMAVLLLLQWPLREWVEEVSNYAINLTQVFFGLYTAFAITAASRSSTHLAFVQYGAAAVTEKTRLWRAWGRLACIAPWSVLVLWTSVPQTLGSILRLERFSESGFNHGFFLLRASVVLLVALALYNAVADVYFTRRRVRQQAESAP